MQVAWCTGCMLHSHWRGSGFDPRRDYSFWSCVPWCATPLLPRQGTLFLLLHCPATRAPPLRTRLTTLSRVFVYTSVVLDQPTLDDTYINNKLTCIMRSGQYTKLSAWRNAACDRQSGAATVVGRNQLISDRVEDLFYDGHSSCLIMSATGWMLTRRLRECTESKLEQLQLVREQIPHCHRTEVHALITKKAASCKQCYDNVRRW